MRLRPRALYWSENATGWMPTRQWKKRECKSNVPSALGDQGRTALAWINCPSLNRIEHDESRFAIFTPKLEAAALNVSENTVFKNNQLKPRIALWDRFLRYRTSLSKLLLKRNANIIGFYAVTELLRNNTLFDQLYRGRVAQLAILTTTHTLQPPDGMWTRKSELRRGQRGSHSGV